MRLVQLTHKDQGRKIGQVNGSKIRLISNFGSIYELVIQALEKGENLQTLVKQGLSTEELDYEAIYFGNSDWDMLPSFDHPSDPLKLMLSGTGLTHKTSAENRQKMHEALEEEELTDSMKMYLWGVENGFPPKGQIGIQPEWFYKGNGSLLRSHNAPLEIPPYGLDGGEEPELAGVYVNDSTGKPWRVGFTTANEFSDHIMERKNYLYLAPSKIRNCAIGPELVLTSDFQEFQGKVAIYRKGTIIWEKEIYSGETHMAHSLENLEYHHFKYANHRLPGQAHVHFFGADAFSFGEGISLQENDMMEVQWEGMGLPLRNPLTLSEKRESLVSMGVFG